MDKHLNTAAFKLRLWVVTVLLAVLGFALVAEFSQHYSYRDDVVRVRVAEIIEHSGDREPTVPSSIPLMNPPASMVIACVILFALLTSPRQRLIPRRSAPGFLHSRAPPCSHQV